MQEAPRKPQPIHTLSPTPQVPRQATRRRLGDLIVLECEYRPPLSGSRNVPLLESCSGPGIEVVRSHLRTYAWPRALSLALWTPTYGLFGAFGDSVPPVMSEAHRPVATGRLLSNWSSSHEVLRVLSSSRLGGSIVSTAAMDFDRVVLVEEHYRILGALRSLLCDDAGTHLRAPSAPDFSSRPAYFLPDWDDFVDAGFDFSSDRPSSTSRSERQEIHPIRLMRPHRLADGILVSLSQRSSTKKGMLRRALPNRESALKPREPRAHFGLRADQWSFGDCGAYSYVAEAQPNVSPAEAAALYDLHRFDLGASVDHIPAAEVVVNGIKRSLSERERRRRVSLTRVNASHFMAETQRRRSTFIPVGVIQGVGASEFGRQVPEYAEMGYRHIAVGGLVALNDRALLEVVATVMRAAGLLREQLWVHLFGVYRPRLQRPFRELGVDSFDSATYFRKAWLRSDQNYIGVDGKWYTALRVPMTSDERTRARLHAAGISLASAERLETRALKALAAFEAGRLSAVLAATAVVAYDSKLLRTSENTGSMLKAYTRTLLARPWRACGCPVCEHLGIHVLIYRGINRGKRRGAHNTLQLFRAIRDGAID